MTKTAGKSTLASRLLRDRGGNFAMVTAVVIPVILMAAGVAIDLTKTVLAKAELQDASDAAVLAAAAALANDGKSIEEARTIAQELFTLQMSGASSLVKEGDETLVDAAPVINITETVTGNTGRSYTVEIDASYSVKYNILTRQLLGHNSGTLETSSIAESGTADSKSAFSMYFVLDKSGSMGEETKSTTSYPCPTKKKPDKVCSKNLTRIDSLKLATASLLAQIDAADPTATYVRTGGVSYNSVAQKANPLDWGTTGVLGYVNALTADGNTNSAPAFKIAYDSLMLDTEAKAHKDKQGNGQVPAKYIVFMTDGDNNQTNADKTTLEYCDLARAKKIEVYTIAFMAPSRGQALLSACATTPGHYFLAESTADLLAAFQSIGQQTSKTVARVTK
ncbi:vWA domain-containing protein [Shinella zoogloeoides]|uniref:vWA domain-containing protein n=1 Tax=Shinella zoogloeoides TaxID=352475 RepID=UPI001F5778B3|nr:VWA domain-containing protein [Shinella zoogloeoides]